MAEDGDRIFLQNVGIYLRAHSITVQNDINNIWKYVTRQNYGMNSK
jgi:hypothetical protein